MNGQLKNPEPYNSKNQKHEKIARLLEVFRLLTEEKFTGYIKVNFSQGGIGRIEKFEEIMK
ncbi:MAG: hypothetical protein HXY45_09990 [Syntrophaceae bacterium]|jgi:hypothetical protein|nr:hypothetical protein [Syntrophaceae bacterium]NWF55111.1 hypothetical protein [Syntrophaceae bacterium]